MELCIILSLLATSAWWRALKSAVSSFIQMALVLKCCLISWDWRIPGNSSKKEWTHDEHFPCCACCFQTVFEFSMCVRVSVDFFCMGSWPSASVKERRGHLHLSETDLWLAGVLPHWWSSSSVSKKWQVDTRQAFLCTRSTCENICTLSILHFFCTVKQVSISSHITSFEKQYFKMYWVSPCKYFLLAYTARNETQVIFVWKRHPVVYRLQVSRQKYRPTQIRNKCIIGSFCACEREGEMWTILSTCICLWDICNKTKPKRGFCSFLAWPALLQGVLCR